MYIPKTEMQKRNLASLYSDTRRNTLITYTVTVENLAGKLRRTHIEDAKNKFM